MAAASLSRSTSRPSLYRTTRWRVISGVCTLAVFLPAALPPIAAGQASHAKTSKGPRALGLLELAPNGKAHLIPITILIDGKYYDAGAYKAAPLPMALWADTVYEGILTGVSQGLFTVTGALQKKDANEPTEWMAEGTWQTAASIKAKNAVKKPPPSTPRGMNEDEGPPVLRRAGSEKPKPPESPATPPPSTPSGSSGVPPAAPSPAAPASSSPSIPSAQEPTQDTTPPEDKDRPVLKRGKPAPAPPEQPQKTPAAGSVKAAASAPTAPPSSASTSPAASSATQSASQIQLIPAISDSHGPDLLPYTYTMKPEEEQQFRKKMLAIAADEIRARAGQLGSASSTGQPIHSSSPRSKAAAAKQVQPTFEDVQLRVFDLADINEPELVLTANARMPQSSHGKPTGAPDQQYMITLVAREDVNGELHKSLANITDTQHMDAIPRLELIDAVDVDGDGRAELLFREVSDAGSAFVIYRVIGDRLYPLFQGTPGQ